jgi:hypothetical protein
MVYIPGPLHLSLSVFMFLLLSLRRSANCFLRSVWFFGCLIELFTKFRCCLVDIVGRWDHQEWKGNLIPGENNSQACLLLSS